MTNKHDENVKVDNNLKIDIKSIDNKELFRLYKDDKSIEIRNELIKRYLYISEILSRK